MKDIVVFGEDFGGLPSSTQHIITRLTKQYRVVWVNSIGLRQPTLSKKDLKRVVNKCARYIGIKNVNHTPRFSATSHPNLHVVNLMTLPAPRSSILRRCTAQIMQWQLRRHLKRHGVQAPLFWASLPTAVDVCRGLAKNGIVYYCGDDFGSLAGVDHATVLEHEADLVEAADLILVASQALEEKFPKNKTVTISHGVDCALFTNPAPKANDLAGQRQVLGFYGSLSAWLDYALIASVAEQNPNWDLVFIGPNEFDHVPLPDRDNIHYLGPRPHHQLPRYSQHWEASWLPFINNQQIQACNPLKLLEYLAAGKPVISTAFPALAPFADVIHVVQTANEVSDCLKHLDSSHSAPYIAIQEHSWDHKAQLVEQLVRQL
ncbi:glycosyltransferase [Vibrio sp. CAU 1672]|uniref:glycosyltransferase n=1 Tax=Vibrio sp. CAU 1672 TaxID=3032594 RepID=UPI0023D9F49F|nr:glycosyltransferase [Vibrio sp. CAU 1672]MDF2152154.1 glycosyltransferase [Vibrio sp. CAU 1672]